MSSAVMFNRYAKRLKVRICPRTCLSALSPCFATFSPDLGLRKGYPYLIFRDLLRLFRRAHVMYRLTYYMQRTSPYLVTIMP